MIRYRVREDGHKGRDIKVTDMRGLLEYVLKDLDLIHIKRWHRSIDYAFNAIERKARENEDAI